MTAGPESMTLAEAVYTNRAMRRLKPDLVPLELLEKLVEAATLGPSGSYRQNWRFFVVTDREVIAKLGRLWQKIYEQLRDDSQAALPDAIFKSVEALAANFHNTPAVIFVGGTEAPPPDAPRVLHSTFYGSLFPAAQNLMLVARSYGLGTTLTTLILGAEDRVRALLGAPDDVALVACIPIGYPTGNFGRPPRNPVSEVAFHDRFGQPLIVDGEE